MTKEDFVAEICHARWCAYQFGAGQDYDLGPPPDDFDGLVDEVHDFLANPAVKASEIHENWMRRRLSDGWVYGVTKDVETKVHPDLVPFDKLPLVEQNKDTLVLESIRFGLALWRGQSLA